MLNRKITSGLVTALALSAITTGAFAAEAAVPAAAESKQAQISVEESVDAQDGFQIFDLKTDENGELYFALADGSKVIVSLTESAENALPENATISVAPAGKNHDGLKASEVKTDENGDQYVELADGGRVYVSQSDSAVID